MLRPGSKRRKPQRRKGSACPSTSPSATEREATVNNSKLSFAPDRRIGASGCNDLVGRVVARRSASSARSSLPGLTRGDSMAVTRSGRSLPCPPVLLAAALGRYGRVAESLPDAGSGRANIVMAPLVAELRHEARCLRERIATSSTLTARISAQCMPPAPTGTRSRSGGKAAIVVAKEAGTPTHDWSPGSDRHLRRAGTTPSARPAAALAGQRSIGAGAATC